VSYVQDEEDVRRGIALIAEEVARAYGDIIPQRSSLQESSQ
jgi:alanine-alpha-ketoisovalerate/valine-pyruvate aminotransferase